MNDLRYTLLADGNSDQALLPILTWVLRQGGVGCAIQPNWANLNSLRRRPHHLRERIAGALDLYPCDLLCLHRDAEREPPERRRAEIAQALDDVSRERGSMAPAIAVIPVRMTEAWLLFNEAALRSAAGNPRGRVRLEIPPHHEIERLANPKARLADLIRTASEHTGRRLQNLEIRAERVADLIDDFSPLRALSAFQTLEADLHRVITEHGWDRDLGER